MRIDTDKAMFFSLITGFTLGFGAGVSVLYFLFQKGLIK